MAEQGNVGARHLIGSYPEEVVEVPVNGRGALVDIDTSDALRTMKAEIEKGLTALASALQS